MNDFSLMGYFLIMALAVLARDRHLLIFASTVPQVDDLDARTTQQVHAIVHSVIFAEHHAADSCLDNKLAAFHAG